jgi:hypothetical protein
MNTKKRLKSGAELEITMASFRDAKELFECIAKELRNNEIDIKTLDLKKEIDGGLINSFKNIILDILTSKTIEEALNKCFCRALYNNKKINSDLFDTDTKAREDYYIICWEVARYNLIPFLKGIDLSSLKNLLPESTKINTQKQN